MVKRTQAVIGARNEPAAAYAAYMTVRSYWSVLLMYFFGGIVQLLCSRSWGRKLLLRYPGLFSNGCVDVFVLLEAPSALRDCRALAAPCAKPLLLLALGDNIVSIRMSTRAYFPRRIFRRGDLSEEDLAATTFSMTFVARGCSGEALGDQLKQPFDATLYTAALLSATHTASPITAACAQMRRQRRRRSPIGRS